VGWVGMGCSWPGLLVV